MNAGFKIRLLVTLLNTVSIISVKYRKKIISYTNQIVEIELIHMFMIQTFGTYNLQFPVVWAIKQTNQFFKIFGLLANKKYRWNVLLSYLIWFTHLTHYYSLWKHCAFTPTTHFYICWKFISLHPKNQPIVHIMHYITLHYITHFESDSFICLNDDYVSCRCNRNPMNQFT